MPKKGREPASYTRLGQGPAETAGGGGDRSSVPKGFVPILVGLEATSTEKVLVKVNQFKDPRIVSLLDMAELELGCRQQGVLRVTCDADYFRRVVGATTNYYFRG